ncbi:hypothetical protein niasHS_015316 [Heterodera schachtii]|uniref:Uncharacterized protein n=1 Tax=Heterodera schachtii TaxID=97005 RepID=A0ABD2IAL0_HETSC
MNFGLQPGKSMCCCAHWRVKTWGTRNGSASTPNLNNCGNEREHLFCNCSHFKLRRGKGKKGGATAMMMREDRGGDPEVDHLHNALDEAMAEIGANEVTGETDTVLHMIWEALNAWKPKDFAADA